MDDNNHVAGVLAAPDKMKGTLGAEAVADAIARALPDLVVDRCPLSDGGDGFGKVMAPGVVPRTVTVTGPLGRPVDAPLWISGELAIVESAAASGLVLVGGATGNDPVSATSRGTGELVVAAVAAGARRVVVGVGGSATTDGGLGAIEAIDEAGGWGTCEVVVACDVAAPFVDAARLFGPQKGATPAEVVGLERRLAELAERYRRQRGVDVTAVPGAGAAGGLAGGLCALGALLVPGFDLVAEQVGLDRRIDGAGAVVSAEGRLDNGSFTGKVVGGVLRRARRRGVPVVVMAGAVDRDLDRHEQGGRVLVVDLSRRFGERSVTEPAACIEEALPEALQTALGR